MKYRFENKNLITFSLISLGTLMVLSLGIGSYSIKKLDQSNKVKEDVTFIKSKSDNIVNFVLHLSDLALRGYALTKNDEMLGTLTSAEQNKEAIFMELEAKLKQQGRELESLRRVQQDVDNYITFCRKMTEVARVDSMKLFKRMLSENRGLKVFRTHMEFSGPLVAFEDELYAVAEREYRTALWANRIVQVILVLLGLPIIAFVIIRLRDERKERKRLAAELEHNNRTYLFDNGIDAGTDSPKEIIKSSIKNFQAAGEFVKNISNGDFLTEWPGFQQADWIKNETTLAGRLVTMRNQLKLLKTEGDQRSWASEGLTRLAEIIRRNEAGEAVALELMKFLVRHVGANQGGLFVVKQEPTGNVLLHLAACFAYDKKKYTEKTIAPGEGLLGQAYLEGQPVLLTQVPHDYIHITSGLGEALPRCIAIVPMKHNGQVDAVLEIASFNNFRKHELEFLENAGEIIAAAMANNRTTSLMQRVLQEAQERAEQLRGAEEEMRQNMEELQATQDHLQRRELEQIKEIDRLKLEHEHNTAKYKRLALVADNMENAVLIRDLEGSIQYVNTGFVKLSGYSIEEAIGRDANLLAGPRTSKETIERIRQKLASGAASVSEEILNYDRSGKEYWTTIVINPIFENGVKTGYISVQADITKTKLAALEFNAQLEAIGRNNAVVEFTLEGKITHANDLFLSAMGYTLEEITGKNHRMFVHSEEQLSTHYEAMWEDLRSGKSRSGEFKRKAKSGDTVWLNGTYTVIEDVSGQPYRVIKFAQNVTNQKVKALDFEGQVNAIDNTIATVELTMQGEILYANAIFLRMMGYQLEELKGKHHSIFVDHDYSLSSEYEIFWKQLAAGRAQSGEFKRVGKDGKLVWLNATYTPVNGVDGEVDKVLKFAQDVTTQKILTIDFESQMKAISMAYLVIEFDTQGIIINANNNFLEAMGYTFMEIQGRHHRIFVNKDEGVSDRYFDFWNRLSRGEFIEGKFSRVTKGGEQVILQGTYYTVKNVGGEPYKVVEFAQVLPTAKGENHNGKMTMI